MSNENMSFFIMAGFTLRNEIIGIFVIIYHCFFFADTESSTLVYITKLLNIGEAKFFSYVICCI